MKKTARLAGFFSALFLLTLSAQAQPKEQAQPVYRCGQTYSQTPCPGAVSVDTSDARSKSQKQESQKATRRDKQLAQELEESRKKEEAMALAGRTPAAGKNMQSTPEKSKKTKPRKKKKAEFFSAATSPTLKKTKKENASRAP